MAEPAQIEKYTTLKRVQDDACEDTFLDVGEPYVVQIATFGGRLLAQSVLAAQGTVSDDFATCTVQSVFMNAGDSQEPMTYKVERASDSRTFAVRIVHAVQGDLQVSKSFIRLQRVAKDGKAGELKPYSTAVADMGDAVPEDLPSGLNEESILALGYTPEMLEIGPPMPFDFRHIPYLLDTPNRPDQFRMRSFFKADGRLQSEHRASHLSALAWSTDLFFVPSALLANYASITKANRVVKLFTTLNHAITFHDPSPRADEWVVVERRTSWSDGGRLLLEQRMWSKSTGKMILTSTQDSLVRLSNL